MSTAFIFPGQGSQDPGMGQDLYRASAAARRVFDQADQAVGFPLSQLCFNGPADELTRTINAQPALVAVSLAALAAAREAGVLAEPAYVAGHSLGEYTALAAAGALPAGQAVALARERGRLMQAAGDQCPGAMAAVIGMEAQPLARVCEATGVVMANMNCPGQIVISGQVEKITAATRLARKQGAKLVVGLQVSGAFHSPLMEPAVPGMRQAVTAQHIDDPAIPVVANTTATPLTGTREVKNELIRQLTSCVHWQASLEYMAAHGVDTFIEIGPGNVLSGLVDRTIPAATTITINTPADIAHLAADHT